MPVDQPRAVGGDGILGYTGVDFHQGTEGEQQLTAVI